jgi:hypothetical protein
MFDDPIDLVSQLRRDWDSDNRRLAQPASWDFGMRFLYMHTINMVLLL